MLRAILDAYPMIFVFAAVSGSVFWVAVIGMGLWHLAMCFIDKED